MKNAKVILAPLEAEDREQFILDNQESFKYGAVEKFGLRDDHFVVVPGSGYTDIYYCCFIYPANLS